MAQLYRSQLLELAQDGAQARLDKLQREIDALLEAFPALRKTSVRPAREAAPVARRSRKRPVWTPAMRKAAADRMKKYWTGRGGAKARKR